MRRLVPVALLIAALVVVASARAATVRYVTPAGGTSGNCDKDNPCDLAFALTKAVDGDTIELAQGTYTARQGYGVVNKVTLRGAAGDRPLVKSSTPSASGLTLDGSGAAVQHL